MPGATLGQLRHRNAAAISVITPRPVVCRCSRNSVTISRSSESRLSRRRSAGRHQGRAPSLALGRSFPTLAGKHGAAFHAAPMVPNPHGAHIIIRRLIGGWPSAQLDAAQLEVARVGLLLIAPPTIVVRHTGLAPAFGRHQPDGAERDGICTASRTAVQRATGGGRCESGNPLRYCGL